MSTTARTATHRIATVTIDLVASVLAALADEFDECEICGHPAAYLFNRLAEDGNEIRACESCVDLCHLSYIAE